VLASKNYFATSGQYIDQVWGLEGALDRKPRWKSYNGPRQDLKRSTHQSTGLGGGIGRDMFAITDDDEFRSMPSLQSVSDSDDDSVYEDDSSEYESDDEDEEYEYDSDDEERMRDLVREAMETAMNVEGMFDSRTAAPDISGIPEDRKDNPFLKLLTNLRGARLPL
jgi:hypothetical protein